MSRTDTPPARVAGLAALLAVTTAVAGCSGGELAPAAPVPTAQTSPPGTPGTTPTGTTPTSATPTGDGPTSRAPTRTTPTGDAATGGTPGSGTESDGAPTGDAPSRTPDGAPVGDAPTTGTVPASTGAPTVTVPSPSSPRPATGREFVRTGPRGSGELTVENGTRDDGYVTLARDGRARVAVYVRAGATAHVRGIADGTYELYSSTGSAWSNPLRAFTSGACTERFDETFAFRTDARSSTEWTVTLQTVPGGTASSTPVDPASVPH